MNAEKKPSRPSKQAASANQAKPPVSEAELDARLARVDGAMGAAGHVITAPTVRAILRQQAAGEISGDEARARMVTHRSAHRSGC
jgi:hypothetical protein